MMDRTQSNDGAHFAGAGRSSRSQPGLDVKDYYRRVTEVDIGEVACDLLGSRIGQRTPTRWLCDCPHHASQSKRSLQIRLDVQGWLCFGCTVGGDVLQLVEFVQSGVVTHGQRGAMPESHRTARDYLAERVGLPPLGQQHLSPEEVAQAEADRAQSLRVQAALTRLASYYHARLRADAEVLAWVQANYAIAIETIDAFTIGYAADQAWRDADGMAQPDVHQALANGPERFTRQELVASGAFRFATSGRLHPFFDRRIVFPYWSRGQVVYLIGRRTPWTPQNDYERSKYKKLPVRSEKHPEIASCIRNDHLYNEDALLKRPDRVVVTEGVTDCLALMERGISTISPVTVRLKASDQARLVRRLAGVKRVLISQDNEISGVGLEGALDTARMLSRAGIETRLVVLPLGEKQTAARAQLKERFGIIAGMEAKPLKEQQDVCPEDDRAELDGLLADAKLDVNEYFASGRTAEEYAALMAEAPTPLEHAISEVPCDGAEAERNNRLAPILRQIAVLDPLEVARHLEMIRKRCGPDRVKLSTLHAQVRLAKQEARAQSRAAAKAQTRNADAAAGSCRACIAQALANAERGGRGADYAVAAEAAFDWFRDNGGRFFRTSHGEPLLFYQAQILWMDSGVRGLKRLYESLIYKETGLTSATASGRMFLTVLSNLATERGDVRDHLSWLHSDVVSHTIYFNLNNERSEIAKITPRGVEILVNGDNTDGIILTGSKKMKPIQYLPRADVDAAERQLKELLLDNLTCAKPQRYLILSWLSCFLLLDFAGTRPMTRFEGDSASGKTTASKLISTLLFGEPQQKKSTDAANYTDGAQSPMVLLDNIETKQMTDELVNFLLTCITGIVKEKRKGGSDTETVAERTKCLVNTTGIEPLGAEQAEVLTRTLTVRFSMETSSKNSFIEAKALASLQRERDLILSALMRKTSQVLGLLEQGLQEGVMDALQLALGHHPQHRANDFLSLMYLMTLTGEPRLEIRKRTAAIDERFLAQIRTVNAVVEETARASNPIATVLGGLFRAHRLAVQADLALKSLPEQEAWSVGRTLGMNSLRLRESDFIQRYQIEFNAEGAIVGVKATELFIALNRYAKDFSLPFVVKSAQSFVQRFSNDLKTIEEAGFRVTTHQLAHRVRTYDIEMEVKGSGDVKAKNPPARDHSPAQVAVQQCIAAGG